MHKMRMAVLASVLAGLLLLAVLSASAGIEGRQYQQGVTIHENSGETLRDYQVLVELSVSDFPEEAQPDGDDIRFTDANGRELSYWIEKFDAGSKHARIWVKVPEIPANGEAGVTMWYGNPSAESESDGEAVFEFFDDFRGIGFETDKWTVAGTSNDNGHITGTVNADSIISKSSFGNSILLEVRAKSGVVNNNAYSNYFMAVTYDGNDAGMWLPWPGLDDCKTYTYSTKTEYIIYEPLTTTNWYQLRIYNDNSNCDYYLYDDSGNLLGSQTNIRFYGSREVFSCVAISSGSSNAKTDVYVSWIRARKYTSSEPTITLAPPAIYTALSITKSPSPYSIRQFQETMITLSIKNSGTTDATDIEITDAIHPSFDLTSGDFPNPKRYALIRPGETRDLQYTISAKESGTFTLDPATVTYADEDGNIQEAKSEPASTKVIPSTEGSTSGGTPRNPSVSTASVQLHGEKTNVVLGEDILLKLSAVNLITKPLMHVQVIIIPPSGMSVTSSAFAKSGAGQYTTTYELESGTGKDIEVAIRSNQVGNFDVNGRIIYYFGDEREDAEDHTLILPITVRAEPGAEQTEDPSESDGVSTPGFAAVVAVIGVLLVALLIKRRRLK